MKSSRILGLLIGLIVLAASAPFLIADPPVEKKTITDSGSDSWGGENSPSDTPTPTYQPNPPRHGYDKDKNDKKNGDVFAQNGELPNLKVQAITITPQGQAAGDSGVPKQQATVAVTVVNVGSGTSTACTAIVWFNIPHPPTYPPTPNGTFSVNALAQNETQTFNIQIELPEPSGIYHVRAIVDSLGEVAEAVENDNEKDVTCAVVVVGTVNPLSSSIPQGGSKLLTATSTPAGNVKWAPQTPDPVVSPSNAGTLSPLQKSDTTASLTFFANPAFIGVARVNWKSGPHTYTSTLTVGPQVKEVHPLDSDFAVGKVGRIMISTEHDAVYHITKKTTSNDGTAQSEDRKVKISAYVEPVQAGVTVYFEVMDPDDPVDQANAAYREDKTPLTPFTDMADAADVNTAPNDNRDPARNMFGGTLTPYNNFQTACLSARSAQTVIKTINGQQRAVAEIELTITDRYSGDNYVVRATTQNPNNKPFNKDSGLTNDPNADADIHPGAIKSTAVLTAWKRVYLEVDKMFRVGTDLTADSGASKTDKRAVHCVTAGLNLAQGDKVWLMDTDNQEAPFGEIRPVFQVQADKIILGQDMTGDYTVAKNAHVGKYQVALNPQYKAFFETDPSGITPLWEHAFVEVINVAKGGGPCPLKEGLVVNNGESTFSDLWFHIPPNGNRKNYFHLVGAHSSDDPLSTGGTPVPNHPTNACFTYVKIIEDFFGANDVPKVIKKSIAHELTHQFDDDPPPPLPKEENPPKPAVVPTVGGDCIMGGAAPIDVKWCIFHVYTVRDEKDAQ